MKKINGRQEPKELTEYRAKPDSKFGGDDFTTVKKAIRNQRLDEQHSLCCYCEQTLKWNENTNIGNVKIEHWKCQAKYEEEQLIYTNMMVSCLGKDGHPKQIHCDTCKGSQILKYSPVTNEIDSYICFKTNGVIYSNDPEFNHQLGKKDANSKTDMGVLNLNCSYLINRRTAKLDTIRDKLKKRGMKKNVTKRFLENLIEKYKNSEFGSIALWYLNKKLKKA